MDMRRLGRTDISVSSICLGTMTFGEQNTRAEGFAQMDRSVEAGVNFFEFQLLRPQVPAAGGGRLLHRKRETVRHGFYNDSVLALLACHGDRKLASILSQIVYFALSRD